MKIRRRAIIYLIGIFLISCMLSVSTLGNTFGNKELNDSSNLLDEIKTSTYYEINSADFGIMGSFNREKSFGSVLMSEKSMVETHWIKESGRDYVNGHLDMTTANFIQNEAGESLENTRVSTYKIIIHDGPSTSDPVLFSDEKIIATNADDAIHDISYPFILEDIENGEISRELTVERIVETQMISNLFNPIIGKDGKETQITPFKIFFEEPGYLNRNTELTPTTQSHQPISEINVHLGTIEIYCEMEDSNHPKICTEGIPNKPIEVLVNHSDDVTVNATIDVIIDLYSPPHPHSFLGLGCKTYLSIDGGYPYNGGTKSANSTSMNIPLINGNLQKKASLSCTIDVNTEIKQVLFAPTCGFSFYPINVWDFSTPGDSFDGGYIYVQFNYA